MTDLYYRIRGSGKPLVLLHGGPDFNHRYLLPEINCLADSLQLILYDQRGRGRSPGEVNEISIESETADFVGLLDHLDVDSAVVVGHSWGGTLAMEFALRVPSRISRLVLMNSTPPTHEDWQFFIANLRRQREVIAPQMAAIRESSAYKAGERQAVHDYLRLHFRSAFHDGRRLEQMLPRFTEDFSPEGIVKAREIDDRLSELTWWRTDYDLRPGLAELEAPTLVIHGDRDFIPSEIARQLVATIPRASEKLYAKCGHFPFIDRTDLLCRDLVDFAVG